MKYLVITGNNSLSHIVKGLAIQEKLLAAGHDALIAVGKNYAPFAHRHSDAVRVLPDIQDTDNAPMPTINWFKKPEPFLRCVDAELDLIREYRPDRIVGVFRFTSHVSAARAGIPYYTLTCGCMLPDTGEILGFLPGDPQAAVQRENLALFYAWITARVNRSLRLMRLPAVGDVRELLLGTETFLWDFPEFLPLAGRPGITYAGPIDWNHWPYDDFDAEEFAAGQPLAVVAFGTCNNHLPVIRRITASLVALGFRVVIAGGGDAAVGGVIDRDARTVALRFAPLPAIFRHARLAVSHGGQMTLFEALRNRVPSLIIPFQPEQDHNGLCMERIGCGGRLVRHQVYLGRPQVYIDALNALDDARIAHAIASLADDDRVRANLDAIAEKLQAYDGAATIAAALGAAPCPSR